MNAFTLGVTNAIHSTSLKDVPLLIREVHQGTASLHQDVADILREELVRLRTVELEHLLSQSERQVLNLLIEGCTRRQISAALNMSMDTVKFHVRRLIRKLGGRTGKEAAERASRRGYQYLL